MKKIFYMYHTVTDVWVKIHKGITVSNNMILVTKKDDCLTNSFFVNKDELISYFEYVLMWIRGDIYSSTKRSILKYVFNNKGTPFYHDLVCKDLSLKTNELIDELVSLEKRGVITSMKIFDVEYYFLTEKGLGLFKIKIKKKTNPVVLSLLLLLLIPISTYNKESFLLATSMKPPTFYEMVEKRKDFIKTQDFDFNLYVEYLELLNVRNKLTVLSQSILETNAFTSNIFYENNNLFGMKKPRIRQTKATGTNRGHATYDHWSDSVKDYYLWYDFMTQNKEYNNYHAFLNIVGYAEDSEYILKLKSIENNLLVENRKIIK